MLRSLKDLQSYAIGATDGPIGEVKDLYFDDHAWVVRYLVVETGSWLNSRLVLISPMSIREPHWGDRLLKVDITQDQVRKSPDIDTRKPVSRQHEAEFLDYYGYANYWGGTGMWGDNLYPSALMPGGLAYATDAQDQATERAASLRDAHDARARHSHDDPHLRSCQAVSGYHIHASDGDIGHVQDLLVEEDSWAIRYMVVNTSNWWMGHQVLVAPQWVSGVHWSDETVTVDLSREKIQTAPIYDTTEALNREREISLYGHYGREGYWTGPAE
jgi:uncharacterized protein YrrD